MLCEGGGGGWLAWCWAVRCVASSASQLIEPGLTGQELRGRSTDSEYQNLAPRFDKFIWGAPSVTQSTPLSDKALAKLYRWLPALPPPHRTFGMRGDCIYSQCKVLLSISGIRQDFRALYVLVIEKNTIFLWIFPKMKFFPKIDIIRK